MIELIITFIILVVISLGGSFVFFKEKKKDIEVDTLNKVIDTLQEENKRKENYERLVNQELLPSYNMYILIGDLEKAEIVKQKIITVVEKY